MSCKFLYNRGCRDLHSKLEINIAKRINEIKNIYEGLAVAYFDLEGNLALYRYEDIPVEIKTIDEKIDTNSYYQVLIGDFDP